MNLLKGKLKLSLIASVCTMFLSTIKDEAFSFTFDYSGYAAGTATQNFAVAGGPDIQISYGDVIGAGGVNGSGTVTGFSGFVDASLGGGPTLTPDDTTITIGNNGGQKLWLAQNLPNNGGSTNVFTQSNANKNIVNFIFNQAGTSTALTTVANFGFTIFDIDRNTANGNQYQDFVGIQGCTGITALTNCTVFPTLTAFNAAAVTIDNTIVSATRGTAIAVLLAATNTQTDGNVFVSFGGTAVNSFRIFYGSGSNFGGATDSTLQQIAISPIQSIPFEFESGLGLSLLGGFWAIKKLNSRRSIV
jgi:hypothetical protein